jgi:hypothetical protein
MRTYRRTAGRLQPGDVVEVRPPGQIVATLDRAATLDALPFMPEMLPFIGKRFTVSRRVESICDTVGDGGMRRMRDTVLLDDLRCDGSAHGGCQAECRLYWKEAWLVRADGPPAPDHASRQEAFDALERLAYSSTVRHDAPAAEGDVFKCQATEAPRATEAIVPSQKPLRYLRELSGRNVNLRQFLHVMGRAIVWKIGAQLGLNIGTRQHAPSNRPVASGSPTAPLRLEPGELVEVRSAEEIGRTLNAQSRHRGLAFTPNEMLPACGKKFRVRRRVERIIDEKTGRMLKFKNECIALEGLVCTGEHSTGRWFCPRGIYPYWREAWLKRLEPAAPAPAHDTARESADSGLGVK